MTSRSMTILTVLLAGTVAVAAQAPVGKTRVDAFFRALASGNADTFEAMAQEHFGTNRRRAAVVRRTGSSLR